MKTKKLSLKKEKVSRLSAAQMNKAVGGLAELEAGARTCNSTQHGFLCCWCSFGASEINQC